jgi:hypothetical protein
MEGSQVPSGDRLHEKNQPGIRSGGNENDLESALGLPDYVSVRRNITL